MLTGILSPEEMARTSDTRQDAARSRTHPEMLERMKMQSEGMKATLEGNPSFKRGYLNQVGAVLGHDTVDRLSQIKAKTLAFNGRYDGSMPIDVPKMMAERIPNCRFEVVEHGHGTWFFDPTVWDLVIGFLNQE